jgi:hypothetical protein
MYKGNAKSMFILFILLLVYGCPTSSERAMDDKLKNGYFAMCYTSQFAERFSLPGSVPSIQPPRSIQSSMVFEIILSFLYIDASLRRLFSFSRTISLMDNPFLRPI